MPRGGKRENAGRRKVAPEQANLLGAPNKSLATEILNSLGVVDWKCPRKCDSNCEICLWRRMALLDRGSLEYLWNRRDGKPVHVVNHLHDKPIEHTVTLTLGEGMKLAMKKAEERLDKRGKP